MAVADAPDVEAAFEAIVRGSLRAIAKAGDQDALTPGSEGAVSAVVLNLIADAAQGIPSHARIKLVAGASDLIDSFLSAVINETA